MANKKISQLTEKNTLTGNDIITILDSNASNANKQAKCNTITPLVNATNLATTEKSTLVADDIFNVYDSENAHAINTAKLSSIASYTESALRQSTITDTTTTDATIDVAENTRYVYTTPLTSLTLSAVADSPLESEVQFKVGESLNFTALPLTGKWINATPEFDENKKYVIAIKNGLAVFGEIL